MRAPAAYELVRSRYMLLDSLDATATNDLLGEMANEATSRARSAAGDRQLSTTRGAFMRYAGQGHEIHVVLPDRTIRADDAVALRTTFEAEYRRLFERHIPNAAIEIMSWSVAVSTAPPTRRRIPSVTDNPATSPSGSRLIYDAGLGAEVEALVYERELLKAGASVAGPAIVIEEGTSTLVSSSFELNVDGGGALVLTRKEAK